MDEANETNAIKECFLIGVLTEAQYNRRMECTGVADRPERSGFCQECKSASILDILQVSKPKTSESLCLEEQSVCFATKAI